MTRRGSKIKSSNQVECEASPRKEAVLGGLDLELLHERNVLDSPKRQTS